MANGIKVPKKLIEVALPLDDINIAAAAEKQPGIGAHPRGLHLWWARRPLAAARAVLFAQLVNDPGGERGYGKYPGQTKTMADAEREKLFQIIRDLVKWENTANEEVLERARVEIRKSWRETCEMNKGKPEFDPNKLPAFHDPFAGGGAIPLEAQRLGLESYASDLNPVAVMINKAMIEIPPKFAGRKPVGPLPPDENRADIDDWSGAKGLAEDVRRYGHWMWEEALKRIGHLYPKVTVTEDMSVERPDLKGYVGQELTVIAWIWARTVKSPNPAFNHVEVPLASSFVLSSKKGHEAWVEPLIKGDTYTFKVRVGVPPEGAKDGTKLARANFKCLFSGMPVDGDYIKEQGQNKSIGSKLLAIVAEGKHGRIYLSPTSLQENIKIDSGSLWRPTGVIAKRMTGGNCTPYGMTTWGDLFTPRQLIALNTFSDLVLEARAKAISDAKTAGVPDDGTLLADGGTGATSYSDALAVYLAFAVNRIADYNSSIATWKPSGEQVMQTFKRQAIPMTWDFPESNILIDRSICWLKAVQYEVDNLIKTAEISNLKPGYVLLADATVQNISLNNLISTDPPYYNNIGYADLSDFFYVWLRRSLKLVFPSLFATLAVPKTEELVATPYRHGSEENAEQFFLEGMSKAIHNLAVYGHPSFPVTIYYAFKQSKTNDLDTASTGWETFLEAVIQAGFALTGTWPMRTELGNRMISSGTNALASSIVLVCKKRPIEAHQISRRDFQRELRETMPVALETIIGGKSGQSPVAPVDLSQAAIGPGMAVFSKYSAVLNQDGSRMSVHDALVLINREITDFLNPDSGSFDADTLFCSAWFDQYGWTKAAFGEADVLARAKGTSVDSVRHAGVIESGGGKVRLLKWAEYPSDWDPKHDNHTPIWEACHHLIRTLLNRGETETGSLLARMPERGEPIRQLAYHLYTLCERKKWAEDARAYNTLVTSWHEIVTASQDVGVIDKQIELDL